MAESDKQAGSTAGPALREPAVGLVAGVVAVVLLTVLRSVLYAVGKPPTDFGLPLYLTGTFLVGWVWGRWAAAATALAGVAFVFAYPLGLTGAGRAVGLPLFLGTAALLVYVLEREQAARARAEAQAGALARERDRMAYLQQQQAADRRRVDEAAAEQRSVLLMLQRETLGASAAPPIRGLSLALAYAPASADALVGGDFYNVFRLSDTRAAVILGDVTGKGAQAAAAGVVVSSMLRAFFAESQSPGDVLTRLNAALTAAADFPLLVTLFAAVVDGETGMVVYANAAQETPCVVSPWGKMTLLQAANTALGAFPETVYEEESLSVPPGHTLVAFTDGLTEIRLPGDGWMDPRRTYAHLAELGGSPTGEIVNGMLAWARSVSGGALRDDAALLAITFEGKNDARRPKGGVSAASGQ